MANVYGMGAGGGMWCPPYYGLPSGAMGPGYMGGPMGPMGMGMGPMGWSPYGFGPGPGYGFGPMTWGGTYPGFYGGMMGPGFYAPGYMGGGTPSDEQIKEMIYDSIDADPAVPFDSDISVDVTGGIVTLTGTVPSKRIKHAVGDDAWWVPGVWDVNNNIQVTGRRERREGGAEMRAPEGPTPRERRMGGRRGMAGPSYGRPYGQY
ncbi:MAG: BON domain-containing protein [Chloroflexota bacterium]|mgnify:CR=1 FL=1